MINSYLTNQKTKELEDRWTWQEQAKRLTDQKSVREDMSSRSEQKSNRV